MAELPFSPTPDLRQYAAEALAGPFSLLLDDGNLLAVDQVVRRVPGKRLVCSARLGTQPVYAKCFIGKQAARYATRDKRGSGWLAQAGIHTPALLLESALASQQARILIYAAVDADNAEQAWQALTPEPRLELALRLVAEVARHHRAGLLQTDLYLKNFLVDAQAVYTLDGDGIRRLRLLGRQCQRLDNLARLISKFDVDQVAAWLPALLAHYAHHARVALPGLLAMQQRITRHWQAEMQQYADKVQRTCTDVCTNKSAARYIAVNRRFDSAGLQRALQDPDRFLDAPDVRRLKSGNTCTVAAMEIDQRKLVIKRYNIKSFWHGLGRAWRPSRAVVSWANAFRLQLKGIATPTPVAVLERRHWGLRREAYLLTEFLAARDAVAFFADPSVPEDRRRLVAQRVATMFYQLYCLQLEHGDFKATNLLIHDHEPVLIDLDSMQQHACQRRFRRRHVRDLKRFLKNWQSDTATQQLLISALKTVYTDARVLQQAGIAN